ncbi:MAG: energy transducer TonB [Candidatus Scalindua sp.]|nr:energy transducer TonB [Candidatus Scalindua sp.]
MQNIQDKKQVNYYKLGFAVSFIIHLLFVLLAFYMKKEALQKKIETVLEFNVTNIMKTGEYETDTNTMKTEEVIKNEVQIPAMVKQESENMVEDDILEKTDTVSREVLPLPDEVERETKNTMEEIVPAKAVEISKKASQTVTDIERESKSTVNPDKGRQGGIPKSAGMPHEFEKSAENQYIREHFDYINRIIRMNISYPYKARKMSMQGDVIITFLVRLDGSVKEIEIKKSSGFSTLDDNAENAVRKASPFPPPPVEVKIVIPITYKLNT